MADIQVIHHDEQPTAGIREQVPIGELTAFFAGSETGGSAVRQVLRHAG